jgi:hypothetical protein
MEQTTNTQQDLVITTEIKDFLFATVKWSKFLAIIGYIAIAIMVLASLFMLITGGSGPIPTTLMGVIYLAMSVLYFFPVKYLMDFSTKIKDALELNNQQILTDGFKNLKSHYKFLGVLTIVMLALYILLMIFFAVFASTMLLR